MRHQALVSALVVSVVIAIAMAATSSVAGQSAPLEKPRPVAKAVAPTKAYTPSKTPDGQPDLQGFWTNSTYVPLERPNGVTKDLYTKEEAEAAIKRAAERESEQTEPGTTADVHYDFTQFGLDRSQSTFATSLRTSQIYDPSDGKVPPMTPEGQKRLQERNAARKLAGGPYDDVKNMPIGSRCIMMGGAGPPLQNAGYNANYQIVQGAGYVMILTEMIHDARIIPIDNRPAPPSGVRQWTGVSRGHYEGNTLVVETTNFNGKNPFRNGSENMKVTERFTRIADDAIEYKFTIDDPSTWTKAWSAELPLVKTDGPIFEFACHETNFGIANILAGAREDDRKAEEKKKGSSN
ncbi:MAG TPA: hypothetical protein VGF24_30780 [Vicinamibacterales bacterium]